MNIIDVDSLVDRQTFNRRHALLLLMSFLVLMSDGFDLGALAFAAPHLKREWSLTGSELGLLLSSSIAAGFLGPPLFGSLSDRIGRKPVIIGGTFAFGLLTLVATLVTGFWGLLVMRILSGVALAGVLPVVATLNNELAPGRMRATLIALSFTGVTLGGALPGFVAAHLVQAHGWRILFVIGGIAPMLLAGALLFLLPESTKFLALRPSRRAELVKRIRALDPTLIIESGTSFSTSGTRGGTKVALSALFNGPLALLTPLYWLSNFCALAGFYFMIQWLPTMLANSGLSTSDAALTATAFNFAGALGGLVVMRLLDRRGFTPVAILFALGVPLVIALGLGGLGPWTVALIVAGTGFCLLGANFGNIATEANIYPTAIRARGVGLCFAMGRVGGGLAPLLGGFALSAGLVPRTIFLCAALAPFLGFLTAMAIRPLYARLVISQNAAEAAR